MLGAPGPDAAGDLKVKKDRAGVASPQRPCRGRFQSLCYKPLPVPTADHNGPLYCLTMGSITFSYFNTSAGGMLGGIS